MALDQADKKMYGSMEGANPKVGNIEVDYDGDDEGDGKMKQQQQYQDADHLLTPSRRRRDAYEEFKTRRILSVQVLAVMAGLALAAWGMSSLPQQFQQQDSSTEYTTAVTMSLTRSAEYTSASSSKSSKKLPALHDPRQELFFTQIVDHNHPKSSGTFQQRYYENLNYFKGPGHPIFVIFGGEGPLEKILYPFISEILASKFGAVTLNPEHRYTLYIPIVLSIYRLPATILC